MSAATLHFRVVTPQRILVDLDSVKVVSAPGPQGQISILPTHAPLLTTLESGLVTYKTDREELVLGVTHAFMEVSENRVNILADYALLPQEADKRRAHEARQRAQQEMEKRLEGTDFQQIEAELRKALLELKLVEHLKK